MVVVQAVKAGAGQERQYALRPGGWLLSGVFGGLAFRLSGSGSNARKYGGGKPTTRGSLGEVHSAVAPCVRPGREVVAP